MQEKNDIVGVILEKFTNELKNQASVSYGGHKNLWVDLGWDILHGDREVSQHVEDLLRMLIINLPEDINEVIWSESWGGKAKLNGLLAGIQVQRADFNTSDHSQADDIVEDIVEYLKDKLFMAAEADYLQIDELESEDDFLDDDAEDDSEEYDEDEDDEE